MAIKTDYLQWIFSFEIVPILPLLTNEIFSEISKSAPKI